ncbi:hypothetical protein NYR70_06240 [Actinobacillus equuli subsp. equuli]|uniref:hypothetical protein n=1 Tax=Actinobacillus equuli TaxID=718 RepID=UPI0024425081|nr:hypothetical protein [Actinobacillus equuli]WGE54250.1 hypothetical protein NYR70_06240 [Actinobacillus equuli subsp. equuli]
MKTKLLFIVRILLAGFFSTSVIFISLFFQNKMMSGTDFIYSFVFLCAVVYLSTIPSKFDKKNSGK